MKKFLILYMAPAETMTEWMKKDPEERKEAEAQMKTEWDAWMENNKSLLKETAGAGKNKRVTGSEIADVSNDVMMFSIAEAETQEEVAEAYKNHPHFGISGATIDIMPANYLPGME